MKNYYSAYSKKTFVKNLDTIVANNMIDHDIYFVTFTFENVHKMQNRNVYTNYFKAFYQKLNQLTINRPSKNPENKARMILVPEKSHQCKCKHMSKSDHYHGFLMMKKTTREKFERKCIYDATCEFDYSLQTFRRNYLLKDELLNQTRDSIKIYNADAEAVNCKRSLKSMSRYVTKRFENPEDRNLDLNIEQVRAFQKPIPALTREKTLENTCFSYDDVQLFCDISAFDKFATARS